MPPTRGTSAQLSFAGGASACCRPTLSPGIRRCSTSWASARLRRYLSCPQQVVRRARGKACKGYAQATARRCDQSPKSLIRPCAATWTNCEAFSESLGALVGAAVLAGCSTLDDKPDYLLGAWGGHIGITFEGGLANVEFDCASGTIDGEVYPGKDGEFTARGTIRTSTSGPVRVGQIFKSQRAPIRVGVE